MNPLEHMANTAALGYNSLTARCRDLARIEDDRDATSSTARAQDSAADLPAPTSGLPTQCNRALLLRMMTIFFLAIVGALRQCTSRGLAKGTNVAKGEATSGFPDSRRSPAGSARAPHHSARTKIVTHVFIVRKYVFETGLLVSKLGAMQSAFVAQWASLLPWLTRCQLLARAPCVRGVPLKFRRRSTRLLRSDLHWGCNWCRARTQL